MIGMLIVWILVYGSQAYNTWFGENLWKDFFIPPVFYSTNLKREKRKKYLILFHIMFFITFMLGVLLH